MKTRLDSTPLSERAKVASRAKPESKASLIDAFSEDPEEPHEQFANEVDIEYSGYETEITEVEPPLKKIKKTYGGQKANRSLSKSEDCSVRTIEYTLINEDTSEIIQSTSQRSPPKQFIEIESEPSRKLVDTNKRRSKAFGKYISALLLDITDDKIFFELQQNITNSIHEATMKQNSLRRS